MARLFVLAAAFLAAVAVARAEIAEEEDVLVLTEANFNDAVKQYNPLLVEFYAPWCGHCKTLAPKYAKAAKTLKGDNLRLAKVDATENRELATRFGIQGFPTMKWFKGDPDAPAEYNGPREAAGIVSWIRKKAGPSTRALSSASDVTAFLAANEVAMLGFFAPDSKHAAAFEQAASSSEDIPYAMSNDDAIRAQYGVEAGAEAIISVNKFPEQEHAITYKGDLSDAAAIGKFADANALPLVIPFTQEGAQRIFRGAIKTHFLMFADPEEEGTEAVMKHFRAVARKGQGVALFVTVEPTHDRIYQYFGINKEALPTTVLVTMPEGSGAMKKFMFEGKTIDEASLTAFLEDFQANKLKAHLKSAEVPNEAADVPVKTVVGKNFDSVVLAPGTDVLLEFYAPWCGHCKSLAPIYEKLGKRFAGVDSVVIAKMDGTENEVDFPGVNVRGFPTIYLFKDGPDGEKIAMEFDGSRDMDGFVKFMKENASKPFSLSAGEDGGEAEL